MTQKLPPLPILPESLQHTVRWFTQVQQLVNTSLQGTNGYFYSKPVAASTVTPPANVSSVILNPVGVLATLTVQLPGGVADGTVMRIVSSTAITALTVTGTGTVVINGTPPALAANVGIAYQYLTVSAANGITTPIWQRLY